MSLSGATTAVKVALWDRKYRCKTKGLNLYIKFMKNRYNRCRRHSKLDLLEWEQEQLDDLIEADEAIKSAQEEAYADEDDYNWDDDPYDGYDDFDWMYEFDMQDEIQEQKNLAWEWFELNQDLETIPEDDLEAAFNGAWKQFAA